MTGASIGRRRVLALAAANGASAAWGWRPGDAF